jgi:hypothetical protein
MLPRIKSAQTLRKVIGTEEPRYKIERQFMRFIWEGVGNWHKN